MSDFPTEITIPGDTELQEPEFSDFAKGILDQIEETDRPIVQKYIKDWDGNVTKKFQEIHEEYKPYKELGDLEDIKQALSWISTMNDDPVEFYKKYTQALKENNMLPGEQEEIVLPEYEGIPQEFIKKHQELENNYKQLSEKFDNTFKSIEEKELIQKVEGMLKDMHTKHGDFDDDWVLLQIQKGAEPEDAIKAFNENIIKKYSSPRKNPPKIMSGGGSVPSGQADLSKMTHKEKLAYAVARLQAANAADANS